MRITSGTSSTITSGNDLIVKVGSGKITLKDAKNLKDIKFDNTKQYNGHSYAIFNVGKTWSEAKTYCEKLGGHLVTITDSAEQSAVENLLRHSTLNYSGYWLGAKKSSSWQWTTGEIFSYRNFASSEPNGSGNYLQMYTSNEFGKWDDTTPDGSGNAGIKQHGFICEWETENPFASINSSIIKGYSSNVAATPWFAEDDNFITGADLDSIIDENISTSSITNLATEKFDAVSILNLAQTDYSFAPNKDQVK